MRTQYLGLAALSSVTLAGCQAFTDPMQNPAMSSEFKVGSAPYHYVATTSDRRLVIFDGKIICMEPPPDTAENVTKQLTGAMSGSGSVPSGPSVSAAANLASAPGNTLSNVNPTAQGIYWFRAVAADYCIAYMNNALTKTQYVQKLSSAAAASLQTVNQELTLTNGKIGPDIKPPVAVVASSGSPTSGGTPGSATPAAGTTATGAATSNAPEPVAGNASVAAGDKATLLKSGQKTLDQHLSGMTQ